MKLLVTGATGLVGTEVIRLALRNPSITSVIAIARKPVQAPSNLGSNADASKLQSIILEDWNSPYPDNVKEKIKNCDACIWTLAITPTVAKDMDFNEVTKICVDYTITGLRNMAALANKPFRFIYVSGVATERDQTKKPEAMGEYRLMRGHVENLVLDFAKQHAPDVEVTIPKPGPIDGPGRGDAVKAQVEAITRMFGPTPAVHVSELAGAMIDQCLNGIEKEPLSAGDLVRIGQRFLREEDYLR